MENTHHSAGSDKEPDKVPGAPGNLPGTLNALRSKVFGPKPDKPPEPGESPGSQPGRVQLFEESDVAEFCGFPGDAVYLLAGPGHEHWLTDEKEKQFLARFTALYANMRAKVSPETAAGFFMAMAWLTVFARKSTQSLQVMRQKKVPKVADKNDKTAQP